jgi:hypothetical protein
VPSLERRAGISDTDIRVVRNLGVRMAATVAGFAAAGFVVATGSALALAAAAAVGGTVAVGEAAGPAAPLATTTFRDTDLLRGCVLLIRSMVPNSPSSLARMARTTPRFVVGFARQR